jgi:hypothetical protein
MWMDTANISLKESGRTPKWESCGYSEKGSGEIYKGGLYLEGIPALQLGVTWYASRREYSYKWSPAEEF